MSDAASFEVGLAPGETSGTNSNQEFIVVTGRKSKKKSKVKVFHHANGDCTVDQAEITEGKPEVLRKIQTYVDLLKSSEYYRTFEGTIISEFYEGIESEWSVVCFGLGPISCALYSRISRIQLALLILLKDKFNISVEVFDPIFTALDKIILSDLGFHVCEANEEAKRYVESPTLFFMPHCPHQLVNNLLYSNWDPSRLSNCALVCNSFTETVSTTPRKQLDQHLFYLPKAQSVCKETPLKNSFTDHPDVFSDISLHTFPRKNVLTQSEEFWLENPCPEYITKDFVTS